MKESILTGDRILTGDGESLEHAPEYRYLIGWGRLLIKLGRFLTEKFKRFKDYFGFTFWLKRKNKMRERMKGEDWIDSEWA